MAHVINGRHLFNKVPTGYPIPGETTVWDESQKIDLENVPLNGGFLLKVLVVSIDPYQRGRMRDAAIKGYTVSQNHSHTIIYAHTKSSPHTSSASRSSPNAIALSVLTDTVNSLSNFGVAVVLRSENPAFKKGDHLYGGVYFQQYIVSDKVDNYRILENKEGLPWSAYVGAAGMPVLRNEAGKTAWFAWKEWANSQKGETVFVSGGAGPVGSLVIQLAKLEGLKVIASAGSDDKVAFLKEIGTDIAFNYKTESTKEVLEREGPINIYWDNVGGETLDLALANAATHARFIECGMISVYNGKPYPIQVCQLPFFALPLLNRCSQNIRNIVSCQIKMYGFIVSDLAHKYEEAFYKEIPAKLAKGQLIFKEDQTKGLEHAGQGILDVQTGKNNGKKVIIVAEE
ncbi:hypothetical protein HWV62_26660 [Athelia sp. TMB]|nr:hypothetical protein HWV62_26660 [Athelia sp. TMB]